MLALALDPTLRLAERPAPTQKPGEALIRVRMAGICNTDLEIVRGYMGFQGVLGHEFVGDVVEADDPGWVGARVNGEINLSCGECEYCAQGLGRHCPTRSVLGILGKDGCFAQYVTLPVGNLSRVPPGLSDESAVFTEPLAAAYEILEQVKVQVGQRVLVVGDGKLGLMCALVLVGTGPEVSLVGRHPGKLAIAEARGVKTYSQAEAPTGWFDIVVEATGSPDGFKYAIERTRPRGTLVLKSTFHGDTPLPTAALVIHEITVVGSRCGPFMPAQAALAGGLVDPAPFVHATYPLRDALPALQRAREPGVLKVLLDMRDGA